MVRRLSVVLRCFAEVWRGFIEFYRVENLTARLDAFSQNLRLTTAVRETARYRQKGLPLMDAITKAAAHNEVDPEELTTHLRMNYLIPISFDEHTV